MILQILSKSITKKRTSNKMFMAAYAVAFASVTLTTLVPCDKHSAVNDNLIFGLKSGPRRGRTADLAINSRTP
ncbi:hypothetical protein ACO0SA_001177 [Hanseniaspora valbyensis]